MNRKGSIIKHVILGLVLYVVSIYGSPFLLAVLLDLLKDVIDPLTVLRYEEVISITISLATLFIIGFVISSKDTAKVKSVIWFAVAILTFSLLGLFASFTVGDLIHDMLIAPVTLSGHFLNRVITNRKNKNRYGNMR
ncbi:hypothetical protein [Cohnella sp.]|uniref:hypothetical protein n=1 Tax=Cohnella sp. TaxID=1883426 RepID=UPI0035658804